jgi:hypothetical protein
VDIVLIIVAGAIMIVIAIEELQKPPQSLKAAWVETIGDWRYWLVYSLILMAMFWR